MKVKIGSDFMFLSSDFRFHVSKLSDVSWSSARMSVKVASDNSITAILNDSRPPDVKSLTSIIVFDIFKSAIAY